MSDLPAADPDPRRSTPRTDAVLDDPRLAVAVASLGRRLVKQHVVGVLEACRRGEVPPAEVVPAVVSGLPATAASLRRVLNATGVVVHTNLGRAPLSAAALEAVRVAAGATDVELDLPSGQRGGRGRGAVEALAVAVPAAEAVHVVNNGAAALALVATALSGAGRPTPEVVVARGEMVEIGDGFRIPELLESTGARIREVGTTNRVRLSDYLDAVDERTGFVLKVHPSNFRVEGFTASVSVRELASGLAAERGRTGLDVPVVADLGSGLLVPHPRLPDEPDAATALREGADLVIASGDKLLGGPQAGLLLGRAPLVHQLRRHPMARALRVDKLTLAALEATLRGPEPPVPAALAVAPAELRVRAERLAGLLSAAVAGDVRAVASTATVGGGGAPGLGLDSAAVSLPEHLAEPLRRGAAGHPPVVGHVSEGRLLLDLAAVAPEDDAGLAAAVLAVLAAGATTSAPAAPRPGTG